MLKKFLSLFFISSLLALFSSASANFEFFNGTWEGRGHQGDINSNWNIKYVIDGHEKKFNFSHSDLECGGMSTLQNASKNSVIFIEKVTFGNRCVDNGKTELRKIDNDTIKYIWYYKNGKQGAEGVLKRKISLKSVDELVEEIEELQVVDFEIPFEGNHWRIQESAKVELDKLGKVLSSNKLTYGSFELVGHVSGISGNNKTCIDDNHKFVRNSRYAKECWKTDSDWAMALSERRASSVKNYLVDNFSIDKNKIKSYGVGDTQHKISDPDNPGNRRVEVKYIKNK